MPYIIPSSAVTPGAVYQPGKGIPGYITANARAMACIKGGALSSTHMLDQSPRNNGTRRSGEEGRCYTADGTDDEVNYGDIGSAIWFSGWVKLNSDDQCLFSLSNDTNTNLIVSSGVLTAGATLTLSSIKVDNVTKTASEAGALLNDNLWHFLSCGIGDGLGGASTADDVRFFTDGTNHGSVSGFDWRFWSTAPTAAELTEAHSGDSPNRNSAALSKYALWAKCDEQSGTTAYDSSGNGNNGTLTNITAATFHATQDIWSFQNQVGYNKRMYFDGVDDNIALGVGDPLGFNGASKIGVKFKIIPIKSPSSAEFIFVHYINLGLGGIAFGYNNSFQISAGGRSIASDPYQNAVSTNTISPSLLNTVEIYFDYQNDEIGMKVNDNDFETFPVSYSSSTYVNTNTTTNTFIASSGSLFGRGVLFDFEFYKNDVLIHSYSGHGNNASDWIDQIGAANGTLNGSPSKHFLPRAEDDTSNDIFGQVLENTGRRPNDAALHSSNCLTADGTLYIAAAHLAGTETVVSSGGTSTPSISAGRIDFTAGTCWDLTLSDGTHYPLSEGGGIGIHDDSGAENHGILTNAVLANAWGGSQDSYHSNLSDGFVYAYQPAKQVFTGAQAANITGISFKFRSTDTNLIIFSNNTTSLYLIYCYIGSAATAWTNAMSGMTLAIDGSTEWGTTLGDLYNALCDGGIHEVVLTNLSFASSWVTDGIFVNRYTGTQQWDSTTYIWDLQATDSNGDPIIPADPDVRLPAVTPSLGPYSIPLTDLPSDSYHNRAETLIDLDPDSTPEMGSSQLGITVPASHAFGDAFAASDQIFSRQRTLTEDRFVVMPEAQTGSALATIQKYTQP